MATPPDEHLLEFALGAPSPTYYGVPYDARPEFIRNGLKWTGNTNLYKLYMGNSVRKPKTEKGNESPTVKPQTDRHEASMLCGAQYCRITPVTCGQPSCECYAAHSLHRICLLSAEEILKKVKQPPAILADPQCLRWQFMQAVLDRAVGYLRQHPISRLHSR